MQRLLINLAIRGYVYVVYSFVQVLLSPVPVISGGGANIKAGKMIFDYTGESSPAATIRNLLAVSYHAGAFDTGKFQSSTADANKGLGWIDNAAKQSGDVA